MGPLSTVCNEIGQKTYFSFKSKKFARTKTKVFLYSNGHNLFRTVKKTWKNQTVWSKWSFKKRRRHILLIFPVLGKMTICTFRPYVLFICTYVEKIFLFLLDIIFISSWYYLSLSAWYYLLKSKHLWSLEDTLVVICLPWTWRRLKVLLSFWQKTACGVTDTLNPQILRKRYPGGERVVKLNPGRVG